MTFLLDIYEKDKSLPIQFQAYHYLSKAFVRHTVHSNTNESDNNLLSMVLEVICHVNTNEFRLTCKLHIFIIWYWKKKVFRKKVKIVLPKDLIKRFNIYPTPSPYAGC